ncbi:alpha/beta hydrolase-fold protein [Microbacterium murale]|uniref:Enterochelin esterase-like enzyme n=1 Tax=Microbacterium murale TaxID=1081040 RepID=A0ABU0P830_9MICO|nr:alpha/beta hydrolase-fold protein [Microbacterium murale]MDQ0643485.1 enterochelin esterase-like enzyme [Microbacterium murale]
MWKKPFAALLCGAFVAASLVASATPAHAASQLLGGAATSASLGGSIEYSVYLPEGYDSESSTRYPSLYLLHGRGDTQAAWQQVAGDLDELIASGAIPPMIVIMPDAPWSGRGSYYVDSQYTGIAAGSTPGVAVETAFTTDLVDHIDAEFRTIDDRASRGVGGYSMGGAGAVRFVSAHQDLFSAALALSPAVYFPTTPLDSSTREFGAYGVGDALYDEGRYQELSYPASFGALDPAMPVHVFVAVGDDEWANPDPANAIHDLDYEAATLYNHVKRVPGVSAELRVYNGGHDWGVWKTGFREGIVDLASYLQTTPPSPFEGQQFGSSGDDRAGGVVGFPGDGTVQALNSAGAMLDIENAGGFDIVVTKQSTDGEALWATPISTPLNERAYGVVPASDNAVIVGGFQRMEHEAGTNDDAFAVKIDAVGQESWRTHLGSQAAADRIYGIAPDGTGGAYLSGYTSGSLDGFDSAGDKDVILARVSSDGEVLWSTQFGSNGEDKGFAVALADDGGVFVGGTSGGALPGSTSAGGYDGWVAAFDADGSQRWMSQFGTEETEQVAALVASGGGVVAAGFTGGVLGESSAGGTDAFALALDADGATRWVSQQGTSGDDRGAAIAVDADASLLLVGHTSGLFAPGSGGVDVFATTMAPDGSVVEQSQFGSMQRDGADEWDEANLYIAGGGSTWVQGLTYGAIDGAVNAGAGDIFLSELDFDAVLPGLGTVVVPPVDPAVVTPRNDASALAMTGAEVARLAAVALLLLLAGGALFVLRRRLVRNPT